MSPPYARDNNNQGEEQYLGNTNCDNTHDEDVNDFQAHLSVEEIHDLLGAMSGVAAASFGVEDDEDDDDVDSNNNNNEDHAAAFDPERPGKKAKVATKQVSGTCSPTATTCRIEIKRHREKQRRTDVKKQFAELASVIRRIESTFAKQDDNRESSDPEQPSHLSHLRSVPPFVSPSNRVELMARTIHLLNSLEAECLSYQKLVKKTRAELVAAQKAGEETAAKLKESITQPVPSGIQGRMLMMVPMIVDGTPGSDGAASFMHSPHGMTLMQYCPTNTNMANLESKHPNQHATATTNNPHANHTTPTTTTTQLPTSYMPWGPTMMAAAPPPPQTAAAAHWGMMPATALAMPHPAMIPHHHHHPMMAAAAIPAPMTMPPPPMTLSQQHQQQQQQPSSSTNNMTSNEMDGSFNSSSKPSPSNNSSDTTAGNLAHCA